MYEKSLYFLLDLSVNLKLLLKKIESIKNKNMKQKPRKDDLALWDSFGYLV